MILEGKKIFDICKNFLDNECDPARYKPHENNELLSFKASLVKSKENNNTFSICDNLYSIKCIFDENFLKKFFAEKKNEKLQIENLHSIYYFILKFSRFYFKFPKI